MTTSLLVKIFSIQEIEEATGWLLLYTITNGQIVPSLGWYDHTTKTFWGEGNTEVFPDYWALCPFPKEE